MSALKQFSRTRIPDNSSPVYTFGFHLGHTNICTEEQKTPVGVPRLFVDPNSDGTGIGLAAAVKDPPWRGPGNPLPPRRRRDIKGWPGGVDEGQGFPKSRSKGAVLR